MARDNREVEATLLSKFAFTRSSKATDHRWLELALPGSPRILTKFSHAREDIGKPLWRMIANQLRVQSNYLDGMIDCTNSRDDYYKKVLEAPNPPWGHKATTSQDTGARQPTHRRHSPRRKK